MIRRRRHGRPAPVAVDGDLVIDGRIRARLVGLPLLDLDAHVVVGTARVRPTGSRSLTPAATPRPARGAAVASPAGRTPAGRAPVGYARVESDAGADGHPSSALGRAVRLLGEGSTALDDARRIRRRAPATPESPRRRASP